MGLPWAHLVVTMITASYNQHTLGKWHTNTGRGPADHPLLQENIISSGFEFIFEEHAVSAVGDAINRLEAAGVLRQRNVGRQRYRVFEAADVIGLFTGLERALASPTGNTATAAPTRRVSR